MFVVGGFILGVTANVLSGLHPICTRFLQSKSAHPLPTLSLIAMCQFCIIVLYTPYILCKSFRFASANSERFFAVHVSKLLSPRTVWAFIKRELLLNWFVVLFILSFLARVVTNFLSAKMTKVIYIQLFSLMTPFMISMSLLCIGVLYRIVSSYCYWPFSPDSPTVHAKSLATNSIPEETTAILGQTQIQSVSLTNPQEQIQTINRPLSPPPSVCSSQFPTINPIISALRGPRKASTSSPTARASSNKKPAPLLAPIITTSATTTPPPPHNDQGYIKKLLDDEILTWRMLMAMILTFVGGVVTIVSGFAAVSSSSSQWYSFLWKFKLNFSTMLHRIEASDLIGIALAFFSSFFLATYTISVRFINCKGVEANQRTYFQQALASEETIVFFQALVIVVVLVPFSLIIKEDWSTWRMLTVKEWVIFLAFSIGVVLLTNMINTLAIRLNGATTAGVLYSVRFISTTLFSGVFLGEWIVTMWQVIGSVLMLVGITSFTYIRHLELNYKKKKNEQQQPCTLPLSQHVDLSLIGSDEDTNLKSASDMSFNDWEEDEEANTVSEYQTVI